jgi:hypothetical protein
LTAGHEISGYWTQFNDHLNGIVQGLPGSLQTLGPWEAAILVIPIGIVFLLYGYRLNRLLATIIFACAGVGVGVVVATLYALNPLPAAAVGAIVFGVLGWLLIRMVWTLMCGFAGWVVGTHVCMQWVPDASVPTYLVLFALGGSLLFSTFGFFLFRPAVIAVSSLEGASGIVWGALRLVALVPSVSKPVMASLHDLPWLLLVAVLVPAIVGAMIQWNDTKSMPGKPAKAKKAKPKKDEGE